MKDIVNMSFNNDFNGEVPCKSCRTDGSRRSQDRNNQRRSRDRRSRGRSRDTRRRSKSLMDQDAASAPKRSKSSSRAGRVTRNPFLNFLRDFRTSYWGVPATQVVTLGAKEWRCLSDGQRAKYVEQAKMAPKEVRRRRRRKRSKSRRRRRRC